MRILLAFFYIFLPTVKYDHHQTYLYTDLALYGSYNECARTGNVFSPISEACNGTISLLTPIHKSNVAKFSFQMWSQFFWGGCKCHFWQSQIFPKLPFYLFINLFVYFSNHRLSKKRRFRPQKYNSDTTLN